MGLQGNGDEVDLHLLARPHGHDAAVRFDVRNDAIKSEIHTICHRGF